MNPRLRNDFRTIWRVTNCYQGVVINNQTDLDLKIQPLLKNVCIAVGLRKKNTDGLIDIVHWLEQLQSAVSQMPILLSLACHGGACMMPQRGIIVPWQGLMFVFHNSVLELKVQWFQVINRQVLYQWCDMCVDVCVCVWRCCCFNCLEQLKVVCFCCIFVWVVIRMMCVRSRQNETYMMWCFQQILPDLR